MEELGEVTCFVCSVDYAILFAESEQKLLKVTINLIGLNRRKLKVKVFERRNMIYFGKVK